MDRISFQKKKSEPKKIIPGMQVLSLRQKMQTLSAMQVPQSVVLGHP